MIGVFMGSKNGFSNSSFDSGSLGAESDMEIEPEHEIRLGGFMEYREKEDWEYQIEGGEIKTVGRSEYRAENGRELLGTESEGSGIERTKTGSETCKDILTRSLGGREWDPSRILIFPNQERGKGPGTTIQVRVPNEWLYIIDLLASMFAEFDGNRSNVLRHLIIQGLLWFGHRGLIVLGVIEARRKVAQRRTELEGFKEYLKEVGDALNDFVGAEDWEGFDQATNEFLEVSKGFPKLWKGRVRETVERWQQKRR